MKLGLLEISKIGCDILAEVTFVSICDITLCLSEWCLFKAAWFGLCTCSSFCVVTLTHSREGEELLSGHNLTITANISVDGNIDTPLTVSTVWARDGNSLSTNERFSISDVSNVSGMNQYQAQIVFSTLSSANDSGTYNCTVQVESESTYTYILSASGTGSATIDVNGK